MKAFISGVVLALCLSVADTGAAAEIPSLDEMAGDWMPLSVVTNFPDVHNFNQMVIVNRDLTSFFCNPGGLFGRGSDPSIQWREGYPLVKLSLDGVEYPATDVRWFAYRALRRNQDCGGLAVETDTRMVNEQRGVLCQITIANPGKLAREIQLALRVPGKLGADHVGVTNATQTARTTSAFRPATQAR